jgi:hypothetical protein
MQGCGSEEQRRWRSRNVGVGGGDAREELINVMVDDLDGARTHRRVAQLASPAEEAVGQLWGRGPHGDDEGRRQEERSEFGRVYRCTNNATPINAASSSLASKS